MACGLQHFEPNPIASNRFSAWHETIATSPTLTVSRNDLYKKCD